MSRGTRTLAGALRAALAGLLCASAGEAAPAPAPAPEPGPQLAAGARVAVLNLLDAQVTQFHDSRRVQDSFLKTYSVTWPVGVMLMDALGERLTQLGFAPVAPPLPEALRRGRETCFLQAALAKGLPKECEPLYAQFAAAERVDAIIVLGPGLNDGNHADGKRRRALPEYLRGWCFVSQEGGAATLLNLSELLLIEIGERGPRLAERAWGGDREQSWTDFRPAVDKQDMSEEELDKLRPLFAGMLKAQAASLLDHLQPPH
jgi:hypothetical protein